MMIIMARILHKMYGTDKISSAQNSTVHSRLQAAGKTSRIHSTCTAQTIYTAKNSLLPLPPGAVSASLGALNAFSNESGSV